MRKRCNVATGLLIFLALFCAPVSYAQSTTKKKVTGQADLPRFSYPVSGSASDLLQATTPPSTPSRPRSAPTWTPCCATTTSTISPLYAPCSAPG